MGRIKEIYIELKREYRGWDEQDFDYLFKQYVKKMSKEMNNEYNEFYQIHRGTAIEMLLGIYRNPSIYTNLDLADKLEKHYASKQRCYIVKEDDLELQGKNVIRNKNEF